MWRHYLLVGFVCCLLGFGIIRTAIVLVADGEPLAIAMMATLIGVPLLALIWRKRSGDKFANLAESSDRE